MALGEALHLGNFLVDLVESGGIQVVHCVDEALIDRAMVSPQVARIGEFLVEIEKPCGAAPSELPIATADRLQLVARVVVEGVVRRLLFRAA